jgi:PKD repeat protein
VTGHRVQPLFQATSARASAVAVVAVLLLLLLPSGPFYGAAHVVPIAPPAASTSLPASVVQTRAALDSLSTPAARLITPDPWKNLTARLTVSPSAREGEALVYDPAGPYVLLFGGATGAGSVHDTWTFANGHWTNLTPNLTRGPTSRYKAVVTYDPADGYVLLFGGRSNVYFNDTWKWEHNNWTELNASVAPSAREDSMMAYDPTDGYVVLFGGENAANHLLNDTWTFLAGTWTNITGSLTLSPPTREAGGMTWDSTDGYVLLFGGSNDPRGDLRDTWTYLGGAWTNRTNLSSSTPVKRETLMLSDDPVDGLVLLFGGLHFPTSIADTWAYAGGTWTPLTVGNAPAPRWGGEVTWDPNAGRGFVLLFGGVSSPNANATYFNDTWTFKVPLSANLTATTATSVDLGGSAGFALAAQGGYPSYSFGWLGLPPGCASLNASSLGCTPNVTGAFNVSAWVTDLAGTNVTSGPIVLRVAALPTVTGTLTPTDGNAPLRVTYNSTIAGDTAPFTIQWQFGDGGSANTSAGTHTFAAGQYTPTLTIVDAVGARTTATGLPAIDVEPALSASISASPTSGVLPLTVDFTAQVSGGWAPYSYAWSLGLAGVGSSDAAPSYTYLTPGTYEVSANVTDSLGYSVVAFTNVSVASVPPLVASASASVVNGTVPLLVTFTAGASGGTGPYAYEWSFGDGTVDASGASLSHTYTAVGNYTATLTVTDAAEATSQAIVHVRVNPVPAVVVPFDANFTYSVGTPYCAGGYGVAVVSLTAAATGGTEPYEFAWSVGTARATGATTSVTVPDSEVTTLALNASDSAGHLDKIVQYAAVGAVSCASSSGQGSTAPNYVLIALIVLVAVVVAVEIALLLRRKPT